MSEQLSKPLELKQALKILGFLKTGYDDYLAARILINHNLLLQGVFMANTAIEKHLKAILIYKGDNFKFTHKTTALLEEIKEFDDKLYQQFDIPYLALIEQCYQLRYIDSAPEGLNVTLVKRRLLAELDFMITLLVNKIRINTNKPYDNKYKMDLQAKNPDLFENNFILNEIPKDEFLKGIDEVYQFSIESNGTFIEIIYQSYF